MSQQEAEKRVDEAVNAARVAADKPGAPPL
jgi:hypothetical protein